MEWLLVGLLLFFSMHLLPSFASARVALVNNMGQSAYLGVYSLISLVGLLAIIYGKSVSPFEPVWQPPSWGRHVTMLLMLISFILLAAAHMRTNLKRYIRHPMLLGVLCWSVGHLLANGDLASIYLFGSFAIYAIMDMVSANHRGAKKSLERVAVKQDVILVVAGLLIYLAVVKGHGYLFGVALV